MPKLNKEGLVVGATDTIGTFSGAWVSVLDPDPETITIEDIAHALSNQCRFTGHTTEFYSVAEHCIHAATLVPEGQCLAALLHDASEAYLSDLARPVKHTKGLGEVYRQVEDGLERAIAARFGTSYPMTPEIKAADEAMLSAEIHALMHPNFSAIRTPTPEGTPIPRCWSPARAEFQYLRAFHVYQEEK